MHGIGFNQISKNFFCIADENWNCKEYPVGEQHSSAEEACYRDILSENWTNILTCGNQHRDLWGCDGYDGCAYGDEYWCRHLDKNFRDVFEEVCSCGTPGVSGPAVSGTNCYIHSALSIGESLCRNCVAEISGNSLHEAVSSGDTQCVIEILVNGIHRNDVDVNEVESASGNTVLHEAAATGRLDVVEALLTNGADVSQINLSGNTALDYGSTESVRQALIDAGAVCGPGKHISDTVGTYQ